MKNPIKNMPDDIKQVVLSLSVSVTLIVSSLFMLYSYVNSIVESADKDLEVMASQTETQIKDSEN